MGTLYSGENELDECVTSIQRQSHKDFKHFIFRNLANKEAHATLFRTFLDKAGEFDVLVKVDADMVLANDFIFQNIVKKLSENRQIDLFAIAVHDFFTDQMIWGLNAYRNTVRWDFEKETVFVDIPELSRGKMLYDESVLAPAAFHCKNPSLLQAFHYGVHRGLKSVQPKGGSTHWLLLERIWNNFRHKKDVRIGMAALGAEMVYADKFGVSDVDYTNLRMKNFLSKYVSLNATQLNREIKKLRLLNWGFLPGNIRRKILILKSAKK